MVSDELYNENRCAIFNYIIENPGNHFGALVRTLDIPKQTLLCHLRQLVKEELIVSKSHKGHKFYYPAGTTDFLQPLTPVRQRIIDIIAKKPRSSEEIAEILSMANGGIDYQLKKLAIMGILKEVKRENQSIWYSVNEESEESGVDDSALMYKGIEWKEVLNDLDVKHQEIIFGLIKWRKRISKGITKAHKDGNFKAWGRPPVPFTDEDIYDVYLREGTIRQTRLKLEYTTKSGKKRFVSQGRIAEAVKRCRVQEKGSVVKSSIRMNDTKVQKKNQWEIAKRNRARLLSFITNNPGIHCREIGRRLKLSIRQMRNAIVSLENEKKIFSEYDGRYKRYFPVSMMNKRKPVSLNAKMRETADIIKENPGISSQDIARKRDRKRPTILYHTGKLMDMMIIKAELRNGKHFFYWTGMEYL